MISIIGLGASSLGAASHEEMLKTLNHAFDAGINYVDLAAGHAPIFKAVGEALKGRRDRHYLLTNSFWGGIYLWRIWLDNRFKTYKRINSMAIRLSSNRLY